MTVAGHMLGFNPKDHDGHFTGLDHTVADVSGVKLDVDLHSVPEPNSLFPPWRIYPKPPPPHWHWSDNEGLKHKADDDDEEFIFENCHIPEADDWGFEIDEKGVYQVYEDVQGNNPSQSSQNLAKRVDGTIAQDKKPVFDIPTIREYFIDLEYVLGVISDGPTKSYAFRRLGYLSSKFTMYQLLNEFQEIAEMKVCISRRPPAQLVLNCTFAARPTSVCRDLRAVRRVFR